MSRKYNHKEKICEGCSSTFSPSVATQRFCGSRTQKVGCSWKRREFRDNHRWLDPKHKEYQKVYGKNSKREGRRQNTPYAERQRKSKREKANTPEGREIANRWRRSNPDRVQEYNRRRKIKLSGVEGFHTKEEWFGKKKEFNFRCAKCNIHEDNLKERWKGTQFVRLTRDHIAPVSKGGADYIDNIQPLCVSCNARKHNKTETNDI